MHFFKQIKQVSAVFIIFFLVPISAWYYLVVGSSHSNTIKEEREQESLKNNCFQFEFLSAQRLQHGMWIHSNAGTLSKDALLRLMKLTKVSLCGEAPNRQSVCFTEWWCSPLPDEADKKSPSVIKFRAGSVWVFHWAMMHEVDKSLPLWWSSEQAECVFNWVIMQSFT